ncbi:MAG: CoA ester lyase [Alphaproteobacteria bacterium]|nr:CoA ester lyase [Alphaproteobacteria bacterium]
MSTDLSLLRSLLFVPGDRPDRFIKAEAAGADGVVFDLEDAVAPQNKAEARAAVLAHLAGVRANGMRVLRINPIATPLGLTDLHTLTHSTATCDALMLPKVEDAAELRLASSWLSSAHPQLRLIALIESARAVELAPAIAFGPALGALAFGGADLAADLGAALAWDALVYQRGRVVTAAAAAGIGVLDVPYLDIADQAGLARECGFARRMGFTGKIAIHPSQVAAINAAFAPTADEAERARRIVAADRAAKGGVTVVDGRMIDRPVVRAAERVLALAERGART